MLIGMIWSSIIVLSCMKSDALNNTPLLISCGLPESTRSESPIDGRVWQSDDDPGFAPANLKTVSSVVMAGGDELPYKTARVFWSNITYSMSITPAGPVFIRLYFFPNVSSNNTLRTQFSTSQIANDFTLLQDLNPFMNSPQNNKTYEFQVILQNGENNLNLTFSPGATTNDTYGYVNGIEIESIPEGLYIKEGNPNYVYVSDMKAGYIVNTNSAAFQTAYRVNVGGELVDERDDNPGGMKRKWEADGEYVVGVQGVKVEPKAGMPGYSVNYTKTTPPYVAPKIVYETSRIMGDKAASINSGRNLTWVFEVDPGFDYVVRLHLREMDASVTGYGMRLMCVYIGGYVAQKDLDIWAEAAGLGIPMYKDFVITIPATTNGTKVPLSVALHPNSASVTDVTLNGLEILKLRNGNNLAVPNPPYNGNETTSQNQTPISKTAVRKTIIIIIIIGGVIGGLLLVSVILLALFRRRVHYKKLFTSSKSSSKGQWLPASVQSQSSTPTTNANSSRPSLPSDLCRRFSLSEIRVATCDFDEDLVIGIGGFGKVYKGCIDDGATNVAIKRLNPTSKQGEHEFLTEIEMLSRLRHLHLVSLIGYCEDQGEMILVYEYMPRGTLRDHLNYKDTNKGKDQSEVLSWEQRLKICIGSARGLDYLHAGAKQLIIHRDVKSTNILLDDKWTAKVSDFGLSKVGPASDTGVGHVSTVVKGSFGYLDPEYYKRGQLTEKSDVFSFGVVLFEVLCARPAINVSLPKEQVNLANWGRACYKKGTLYTIVDPNLSGQIAPECLRKFGEIADMCVRSHRDERPSMRDIVWSLEYALRLQQTAEKNTGNVSPMVDVPSNTDVANEGDGVDSSREFGSNNTGSTATTNTTITNYVTDIKSGSVFSEILNPRAR